jgi:catechol 2,3-dioxygenase-like lactoylglutathione lyase family enzyme
MLDHVSIPVRDADRTIPFYDAVMAAIGMSRVKEVGGAIGYGLEAGWPIFWLEPAWLAPESAKLAHPGLGLHLSFRANSRAEVHAFHAAALAHGGRDAGAPGPRPQYSSGFYGAFALDPEGFKIEAVIREDLPANRPL